MASLLSSLKQSFYDPFANYLSGLSSQSKQLAQPASSGNMQSTLANPGVAATAPKSLTPTSPVVSNQPATASPTATKTLIPAQAPVAPATTTGGANLTLDAKGNVTSVSGGGTSAPATSASSTDDYTQKLQTLQTQLIEKVLSNLENYTDPSATIQQQYADRQKAIQQAQDTAKQILKEQYGEAIGEAQTTGQRTLTSAQEARRGFATNTAVFSQIQESTDKRVRQLVKDRDMALAMADSETASQLSDLIFKEQEALTNARTGYMDNVFKTLSGVQSALGFETPEQQRKATTEQEIAIETAKQKIRNENPEIQAIDDFTDANGNVSFILTYSDGHQEVKKQGQIEQGTTMTASEQTTQAEKTENTRILNELSNYGQRTGEEGNAISLGYFNQVKASQNLYSSAEFDKKFGYLLSQEDRQTLQNANQREV